MLSTEPSLTSPARDLSQALTHVPAVRAQLGEVGSAIRVPHSVAASPRNAAAFGLRMQRACSCSSIAAAWSCGSRHATVWRCY